jgi:uncharacterized protein
VRVADTMRRRLRGLLGRGSLPIGEGIVLRPAVSIHTAFLRFPIDIVFLDPEQVVIRIDRAVGPFKANTCFEAREVVALPAGECERRGLHVGDRVAWAARSDIDELSAEQALAQRETTGRVLVASSDQRFVKLTGYLLGERSIGVSETVAPTALTEALADSAPDAVLLDAGDAVGEGLRAANAARARRPEVPIVIAAESAAGRSPTAMRVYDKWDETDELVEAVAAALGRSHEGNGVAAESNR